MKTAMKLFLILLAVIAAAALCCAVFLILRNKKLTAVPNTSGLKCVTYYSGGGMDGGVTDYTAELQKNGSVRLMLRTAPQNGARTKTKTTLVSAAFFLDAQAIADSYTIDTLGELPDDEVTALDAATRTISFIYEDGRSYSFDSNQQFPEGKGGVLSAVRELFGKYE